MIYVAGDLHCDVSHAKILLGQVPKPSEDDAIVFCGDIGYEYGNRSDESFLGFLATFPGDVILMRGNHDARYWERHTRLEESRIVPEEGWEFSRKYKAFTLVPQGTRIHFIHDAGGVYDLQGHACLFVPGAFSVDGEYRRRSAFPYEPKEQMTPLEFAQLEKRVEKCASDIEFVFSHTYPREVEKDLEDLFIPGLDQNAVDKTTEDWIQKYLWDIRFGGGDVKQVFFGHVHGDRRIGDKHTMLYNKIARLEDYV